MATDQIGKHGYQYCDLMHALLKGPAIRIRYYWWGKARHPLRGVVGVFWLFSGAVDYGNSPISDPSATK